MLKGTGGRRSAAPTPCSNLGQLRVPVEENKKVNQRTVLKKKKKENKTA